MIKFENLDKNYSSLLLLRLKIESETDCQNEKITLKTNKKETIIFFFTKIYIYFIVLNVKFKRGACTFFVFGSECFQKC